VPVPVPDGMATSAEGVIVQLAAVGGGLIAVATKLTYGLTCGGVPVLEIPTAIVATGPAQLGFTVKVAVAFAVAVVQEPVELAT